MGYKRCFEANEFEDLPFSKAKRLECNDKLVSFAGSDTPNNAPLKPIASGKDEDVFYNIQWCDAIEPETVTRDAHAGEKDIETSGHFSSSYSEDGSGSGATSLPASLDSLEFDFPLKASVPLDDAYSVPDSFQRKQVSVGPNHQATVPVWKGRGTEVSVLTGTHDVDGNEERLMGISVITMPDLSIHSCKSLKDEGRRECTCLDQNSIRCVRQHVREEREHLMKTLGNETFMNLGFGFMGEEVSLKWTEEEEDLFHEIVYTYPARLGRNFWKQLSAAFPSRTKKEIVSYYYNVFMLWRRAAQNRSRFLNIDSDDDECPTSNNVGFYGFEASEEDDSAIESPDDQDVHVGNQDIYSDDDGEDDNGDNGDNGTDGGCIGIGGYDKGKSADSNSQIESLSEPVQQANETVGFSIGSGVQDDSCMSFKCPINMDEPCPPCGHGDASPALQACGFRCDQSPLIPGIHDFSSDTMERIYFSERCDAKDWSLGYPAGPASDIDFSATSKLIEEFLCQVTPDRKTKND